MQEFLYLVKNNITYNLSSIGIILLFSIIRTFLRKSNNEIKENVFKDFAKTFSFLILLYFIFIIIKWYPMS